MVEYKINETSICSYFKEVKDLMKTETCATIYSSLQTTLGKGEGEMEEGRERGGGERGGGGQGEGGKRGRLRREGGRGRGGGGRGRGARREGRKSGGRGWKGPFGGLEINILPVNTISPTPLLFHQLSDVMFAYPPLEWFL